jgi:arginase family enzyme
MPCAVIFGAGHGSTYPGKDSSGYALAADAIRAASQGDAALVEHWDFDLGGPLFDSKPVCCIDAGDIPTIMRDNAGDRARIEAKTREVQALPAVPILLGGDDSVPIPFNASFVDHGPVWILQIDAHIDWRDVLHGERYGYSSAMLASPRTTILYPSRGGEIARIGPKRPESGQNARLNCYDGTGRSLGSLRRVSFKLRLTCSVFVGRSRRWMRKRRSPRSPIRSRHGLQHRDLRAAGG